MPRTPRLARIALVLAGSSVALVLTERGFAAQKAPAESKPARPVESKPHKRSAAIEASIRDGLCWLARHQNPDGSWSPTTVAQLCDSSASIYRPTQAYEAKYDAGITGLAVLAIVGALRGSGAVTIVDPTNGASHDLTSIAKRGVERILARQRSDGSFAKDQTFMYREALATQAVCEAYAVLDLENFAGPAQKALDFIQAAQRPSAYGNGLWGWRYEARKDVEDFHKSQGTKDKALLAELYDSDTSITGRCMSALHAGAKAGLAVKKEHLAAGVEFVRYASLITPDGRPTGLVGYMNAKGAGMKVMGAHDSYTYHPAVMSALGVSALLDGNVNAKDPFFAAAVGQILKDLPTVTKDYLSVDYYFWHNATRALSRIGGPASTKRDNKMWSAWNKAVKESLMAIQDRTAEQCTHGGWLVEDRWTFGHGGPIYTTALAVMTLQECE